MKRSNCVFGIISLIIISILNLLFTLPLFTTMVSEQIRIGQGTNLDIGAIAVWIFEGLCFVPFTACIVFTIISIARRDYLPKIIINIFQIVLYLVLHILSNICIFL